MPNENNSDFAIKPPGFSSLIAPLTVKDFVDNHWDHEPLIAGGRGAGWFHDLFTLADFDEVLNHNSLRYPFVRVVKEGAPVSISGGSGTGQLPANHIEEIFAHHRDGATIVLQFLHEWVPKLKQLAADVSATLTAPTQINAYLTPPGQRGLKIHYDTHDVFVLQIAGRKDWQLFERTTLTPFRNEMGLASGSKEDTPVRSLTLDEGDCLYLPSGCVHRATSADCTSLHLTVGVHPVRWAHVMQKVVESALRQDPKLRDALPPGFASDSHTMQETSDRFAELWSRFSSHLSAPDFLAGAVDAANRTSRTDLRGHLCDLVAIDTLSLDSALMRRAISGLSCTPENGSITLNFHGKTLSFPEVIESSVRFILDNPHFCPQDLPDILHDDDKITLVRRLIEEGLLTFARAGHRS